MSWQFLHYLKNYIIFSPSVSSSAFYPKKNEILFRPTMLHTRAMLLNLFAGRMKFQTPSAVRERHILKSLLTTTTPTTVPHSSEELSKSCLFKTLVWPTRGTLPRLTRKKVFQLCSANFLATIRDLLAEKKPRKSPKMQPTGFGWSAHGCRRRRRVLHNLCFSMGAAAIG